MSAGRWVGWASLETWAAWRAELEAAGAQVAPRNALPEAADQLLLEVRPELWAWLARADRAEALIEAAQRQAAFVVGGPGEGDHPLRDLPAGSLGAIRRGSARPARRPSFDRWPVQRLAAAWARFQETEPRGAWSAGLTLADGRLRLLEPIPRSSAWLAWDRQGAVLRRLRPVTQEGPSVEGPLQEGRARWEEQRYFQDELRGWLEERSYFDRRWVEGSREARQDGLVALGRLLVRAHRVGRVHGAIAPNNLLADQDGWVLVDPATERPTRHPTTAPEVMLGARPGAAADVFGLAWLWAGWGLADAPSPLALQRPAEWVEALAVRPEARQVLAASLQPRPEDRPPLERLVEALWSDHGVRRSLAGWAAREGRPEEAVEHWQALPLAAPADLAAYARALWEAGRVRSALDAWFEALARGGDLGLLEEVLALVGPAELAEVARRLERCPPLLAAAAWRRWAEHLESIGAEAGHAWEALLRVHGSPEEGDRAWRGLASSRDVGPRRQREALLELHDRGLELPAGQGLAALRLAEGAWELVEPEGEPPALAAQLQVLTDPGAALAAALDSGRCRDAARLAERAGLWTDAARAWQGLVLTAPQDAEAWAGLAVAADRLGWEEEAVSSWTQCFRRGRPEQQRRASLALAQRAARAGRVDEAEAWFRRALPHPAALRWLGRWKAGAGHPEGVTLLHGWAQAVEGSEEEGLAWAHLALAHLAGGGIAPAQAALSRAIQAGVEPEILAWAVHRMARLARREQGDPLAGWESARRPWLALLARSLEVAAPGPVWRAWLAEAGQDERVLIDPCARAAELLEAWDQGAAWMEMLLATPAWRPVGLALRGTRIRGGRLGQDAADRLGWTQVQLAPAGAEVGLEPGPLPSLKPLHEELSSLRPGQEPTHLGLVDEQGPRYLLPAGGRSGALNELFSWIRRGRDIYLQARGVMPVQVGNREGPCLRVELGQAVRLGSERLELVALGEGTVPVPVASSARPAPPTAEAPPPAPVAARSGPEGPPARLVLQRGLAQPRELRFSTPIRVGHHPDCEICVQADPMVAPVHALLEPGEEGWSVRATEPRGTVWVTGNRTRRQRLIAGDTLVVGRSIWRFLLG